MTLAEIWKQQGYEKAMKLVQQQKQEMKQEGKLEGKLEAKLEVAKAMLLKGLDIKTIASVTKLPAK